MEDDDEFGDLYTDVLRPFASSSSSSAPQPHHSSPAPPSIDLNLNAPEIPYAVPHSNSPAPHPSPDQIAPSEISESTPATAAAAAIDGRDEAPGELRVDKQEESAGGGRVIDSGDAEFSDRASPDLNRGKEWIAGGEVGAKGDDLMDKEVKFDIEDDGDGIGLEPVIPGLSTDVAGGGGSDGAGDMRRVDGGGENGEGGNDDWDSDSDDDLQIVLNDNSHMAMERGGMVGDDDDEDEDGGLVIVADGDPNQGVEEQDWGENAALPADSERKDAGEVAKPGGGVAVMPKIAYSNHGYHPFHSQYKVSVFCWLKSSYLCLGFQIHFIV